MVTVVTSDNCEGLDGGSWAWFAKAEGLNELDVVHKG